MSTAIQATQAQYMQFPGKWHLGHQGTEERTFHKAPSGLSSGTSGAQAQQELLLQKPLLSIFKSVGCSSLLRSASSNALPGTAREERCLTSSRRYSSSTPLGEGPRQVLELVKNMSFKCPFWAKSMRHSPLSQKMNAKSFCCAFEHFLSLITHPALPIAHLLRTVLLVELALRDVQHQGRTLSTFCSAPSCFRLQLYNSCSLQKSTRIEHLNIEQTPGGQLTAQFE